MGPMYPAAGSVCPWLGLAFPAVVPVRRDHSRVWDRCCRHRSQRVVRVPTSWEVELTYSKIDAWTQTRHHAELLAEAWSVIAPPDRGEGWSAEVPSKADQSSDPGMNRGRLGMFARATDRLP